MKGAPRTAPERSPNGRRRPFGRRREMVRRAFPFSAKSRSSRNCARRAAGPDGPANESLHRQANRVPRLRAGRRGYGLERTRNDDRDDEIAGPRWARSPWTTNPSTPSRGAGGQTPFGPQEVETMRQTLQSSVRHFRLRAISHVPPTCYNRHCMEAPTSCVEGVFFDHRS